MKIKIKMLDPAGVTVKEEELETTLLKEYKDRHKDPVDIELDNGEKVTMYATEPMRKNRYLVTIGKAAFYLNIHGEIDVIHDGRK